jgi:hypothetical protein
MIMAPETLQDHRSSLLTKGQLLTPGISTRPLER